VRSGPGENFPAIEVAKAGTEVTILESKNGWSRVSYERNSADQGKLITIEGYIKNSILNSANTPTTTTTATNNSAKKTSSPDTKVTDDDNKKASGNSKNSDVYSIKISSSLRVRSEPADDADVLEVIKSGTVVSVIRSANGWSYVSYPGNSSSSYAKSQTQKGYIKNSVLK
ncbi:MAG: SH3 domain-containing protein, partial [Segetibacter sp.]